MFLKQEGSCVAFLFSSATILSQTPQASHHGWSTNNSRDEHSYCGCHYATRGRLCIYRRDSRSESKWKFFFECRHDSLVHVQGPIMNANQSNYVSRSVPNVAQPIYQNRQPSIASAYSESRYAPTPPQHVPTPSQPTVQTASNITQHPNGYQISPMMSQQDYSRLFQAHTRLQQLRQVQSAPLPAQPMHQQQKEIGRQTPNTQQYIKPSHPPQQGTKTTGHVSVQNQVPTRINVQRGQGLQNSSSASNGKTQKQPVEAAVQAQAPLNTLTRDASAINSTILFL